MRLTEKQNDLYKGIRNNTLTVVHGPAGTSKTFTSCYTALSLLADKKIDKIIITKPIQESGEQIGLLPGTVSEKIDPYKQSYYTNFCKILDRPTIDWLFSMEAIVFEPLAYMRGWNVDNTILVFEEAQNATPSQIKLLLTRIGFNSKFFISGDLEQSDKYRDKTKSGLYDAKMRLQDVKGIGIFEFGIQDIVRNPIIGEILNRYD